LLEKEPVLADQFELTKQQTLRCKHCRLGLNFRDSYCLKRHLQTVRHFNSMRFKRLEELYQEYSGAEARQKQDQIFKLLLQVVHKLD